MLVDNAGSSAEVAFNEIQGAGPTPLIAQNGIQASRDASADIHHNVVSGNNYALPGTDSVGILVFQESNSGTTVDHNRVSLNDDGIYLFDPRSDWRSHTTARPRTTSRGSRSTARPRRTRSPTTSRPAMGYSTARTTRSEAARPAPPTSGSRTSARRRTGPVSASRRGRRGGTIDAENERPAAEAAGLSAARRAEKSGPLRKPGRRSSDAAPAGSEEPEKREHDDDDEDDHQDGEGCLPGRGTLSAPRCLPPRAARNGYGSAGFSSFETAALLISSSFGYALSR